MYGIDPKIVVKEINEITIHIVRIIIILVPLVHENITLNDFISSIEEVGVVLS